MIVAGFGYRTDTQAQSLHHALLATGHRPDVLVGLQEKDHRALQALGQLLACPVRLVSAAALKDLQTLTESPSARAAYGVGSVAEAVALAAAGRGAVLIGPRQISEDRMASCAMAKGAAT